MHTSGKVAVWLICALMLGAIYLSVKAHQTRKAWMELAQKNEDTYRKNVASIEQKTAQLDSKKAELARAMLGWDRYWPAVPMQVTSPTTAQLGIGTNHGIRDEEHPALFVFVTNDKGVATYLGKFKVVRARDAACEIRPDWRVRPGELTPGATYGARVRTLIPNQYQSHLSAVDQQLLSVEQRIATEEDQLAKQQQLAQQTDAQIGIRLGELKGNESHKDKQLPEALVKGYLAAIAGVEESRNTLLVKADELRRDLKATRRKFQETLDENRRLTESLPQAPRAERTVGAAAR